MATKRGRLVSLSVMFALGSMLAVDVMAQQAQVVGTLEVSRGDGAKAR